MPPRRTYGSRRPVAAAGAARIFGSEATVDSVADLLASTRLEEEGEERVSLENAHSPLHFALSEDEDEDEDDDEDDEDDDEESVQSESTHSPSPTTNPALEGLKPLLDAIKVDTGTNINVLAWKDILPQGSIITKIAEASYAEVYRVTTKSSESSIIKILQLKVPADASSYEIETANVVENVVSEIRIMNALTEVPGFVTFRGTYIVQGPPPKQIVDAYNAHLKKLDEDGYEDGSNFPHPGSAFNVHSTFLVLELGDAGSVLESISMVDIDQVWDVLLGVVMALSRAEITSKFEHRDLHENNICVRTTDRRHLPDYKTVVKTNPDLKFGFSGLGITLIDYGLSRALLESGDVIYNNLESDLEVFHSVETGVAGIQFDTYRRMRTHMIEGTHTMKPVAWHDDHSLPAHIETPWKEFTPYTNVLWIRYIYHYLVNKYKYTNSPHSISKQKSDSVYIRFNEQTRELSKRLNPKTKVQNGAFTSAQDVLSYVVEQKWVSEKQLETFGVDESICEVGIFIEDEEVEDTESDTSSEDD